MFVEAVIPPSQQQETVPGLGERGVRTDLPAGLAGLAGTGEPGHSHVLHTHPRLCPALLVLIPLGISENSCWTPFFMDLRAGSREGLEQPCAWQGTRGSAVLLPLGKTLCFCPPPKPPCINCEQLHGQGSRFTRDLGLLHTSATLITGEIPSQCGATSNCRPVLPEIQPQARHGGLVGSQGLRLSLVQS